MFATSSQRKYWSFKNEQEINNFRMNVNRGYIERHGQGMTEQQQLEFFLTPEEERALIKHYELCLRDFCKRFEPQMPKCVIGTAFHYFKRFYLRNSPMDYHPKEILVTCVYLSCKVEEFNVSINQFVENIKGDRAKAMDVIISSELLLMQQLNFCLTIYNPYRPIEGFLIDMKARCTMANPERLRIGIDDFIDTTFLTDVCLLYAPSQIALAGVLHSASKIQENLDSYVTKCLFHSATDKLPVLVEAVRKIRSMVKTLDMPSKNKVKIIERKLEKCRNQDNNPDSANFKHRMRKMLRDFDDLDSGDDEIAPEVEDVSLMNSF